MTGFQGAAGSSAKLIGTAVPSGVGVEFSGFDSLDYRKFILVLDDVGSVANPTYAQLQLGDGAAPVWRTGLFYSTATVANDTIDPGSSVLNGSAYNLGNIGYTGKYGGRIEISGHAPGGCDYPTLNYFGFRRYGTTGPDNANWMATGTYGQPGAFQGLKYFVAGTMYGVGVHLWGLK